MSITETIQKFVMCATCSVSQKQQEEEERKRAEEYRPIYKNKNYLARLRAEIVGAGSSLRFEKHLLKKKLPETLMVKRADGSGHFDKIHPQANHQALHQLIKSDLKASTRAKLIAYGILRGKNYKDVESAERLPEWWKSYESIRLVRMVAEECSKHGADRREQEWFKNVENVRKLMMNGEAKKNNE